MYRCVSLYPDFFKIGADGKVRVTDGIKDVNENKIKEMAASCPMAAIRIISK